MQQVGRTKVQRTLWMFHVDFLGNGSDNINTFEEKDISGFIYRKINSFSSNYEKRHISPGLDHYIYANQLVAKVSMMKSDPPRNDYGISELRQDIKKYSDCIDVIKNLIKHSYKTGKVSKKEVTCLIDELGIKLELW